MSNMSIKEAKKIYIETGRLNRNLITKEVSISWYKCKLQNLEPTDAIKISNTLATNNFEPKFLKYIDSIIGDVYQYVLVNTSLKKCASRISDNQLVNIDSIDDLSIGTNGGYLTFKTQSNQMVSLEEHYLDCLCDYYSMGLLILKDEKIQGVIMLLSVVKPSEYDLGLIREKLIKYNAKADFDIIDTAGKLEDLNRVELSSYFAYPLEYMNEFSKQIDKLMVSTHPILIEGSVGSGKSTLALYFALNKQSLAASSCLPTVFCLDDIPRNLQKQLIETALYQNETVIIESIEGISSDALSLLTVYSEEKIVVKNSEKYRNHKCLNLILSIDNTKFEMEQKTAKIKQIEKFANKMNFATVNLVNTQDFANDITGLMEAILRKNNIKASVLYKTKLKSLCEKKSFKQIQKIIEISMELQGYDEDGCLHEMPIQISEKIESLEDQEKHYICHVYDLMDRNMTITAETLKIGRSTLYRKLEKYHNDTVVK